MKNLIFLLLLISTSSFAKEISEMYNDVRMLGMGNSGLALVKDYNSLYYNPAGLAKVEHWNVDAFFFGELGEHSKEVFDKIKNKEDGKNIATQIEDYIGTHQHLGIGGQGSFVTKRKGMGVLINNFSDVEILGPSSAPLFNFELTAIQVVSLGYAKTFGGVNIGIVPRFINQLHMERSLSALELEDKRKDLFKLKNMDEGFGIDADLGANYSFALTEYWEMSVGAVGKHLINPTFKKNYGFFNNNTAYHPPAFGRRLDLGLGLEGGTFAEFFTPRIALDVKNIGEPHHSDESMWMHVHAGTELKVAWMRGLGGAFRLGINQGYPSAGMSGYVSVFRLDLAYYTEELGVYPGQRPDNRYAFQIGLDI